MKKRFWIIGMLAAISCGEKYNSSIPDVAVNHTINLLQNPYYRIKIPGVFIPVMNNNHYQQLGYGGLIVGQSVYGYYLAFDAACPVEINRSISVEVLDDGIGTAICPSCQTKYNLSEGGFPERVNGEYLKRYKVSVNNDRLRVTN